MRLPVAGPIHVFVGAGGPLFALFPVLEVAVYGIPSDCCDPDPWRPSMALEPRSGGHRRGSLIP